MYNPNSIGNLCETCNPYPPRVKYTPTFENDIVKGNLDMIRKSLVELLDADPKLFNSILPPEHCHVTEFMYLNNELEGILLGISSLITKKENKHVEELEY